MTFGSVTRKVTIVAPALALFAAAGGWLAFGLSAATPEAVLARGLSALQVEDLDEVAGRAVPVAASEGAWLAGRIGSGVAQTSDSAGAPLVSPAGGGLGSTFAPGDRIVVTSRSGDSRTLVVEDVAEVVPGAAGRRVLSLSLREIAPPEMGAADVGAAHSGGSDGERTVRMTVEVPGPGGRRQIEAPRAL